MTSPELYVLDEDKQLARARIAELEQMIQELGPEFYDVFNQSSETWHDNAPFDALRDRQSVMAAELQSLKRVLANTAVSLPRRRKNLVGMGAFVDIANLTSKKEFTYYIAGTWTFRTGELFEGALIISADAPLAQALMGKKIGTTVQFRQPLVIVRIRYI